MKIGSQLPVPPTTAEATSAASTPAAREGGLTRVLAGAPVAAQETVTLSAGGSRASALSSSADFDERKVEAIRQAIREGRFSINSEAIADRLLSDAAALVSGRAH